MADQDIETKEIASIDDNTLSARGSTLVIDEDLYVSNTHRGVQITGMEYHPTTNTTAVEYEVTDGARGTRGDVSIEGRVTDIELNGKTFGTADYLKFLQVPQQV